MSNKEWFQQLQDGTMVLINEDEWGERTYDIFTADEFVMERIYRALEGKPRLAIKPTLHPKDDAVYRKHKEKLFNKKVGGA